MLYNRIAEIVIEDINRQAFKSIRRRGKSGLIAMAIWSEIQTGILLLFDIIYYSLAGVYLKQFSCCFTGTLSYQAVQNLLGTSREWPYIIPI
ncbi:MAG: hypothetical protein Q8904_04035 [Bacteroidota bacterium]|nr:hypothetical protein [Bacteroidota bacterium]